MSFAKVSRSDSTLLTCPPAGRITYWDMAKGNPIKEVETIDGPVNVRMSDDRETRGRSHVSFRTVPSRCRTRRKAYRPPPRVADRFEWRPQLVGMTQDSVLLAGDDGQIGLISEDGYAVEIARDVLAQVSSVGTQGHVLAAAGGDLIRNARMPRRPSS